MSWMDNLDIEFRYACPEGHKSLYEMPATTPDEVTRSDKECLVCGALAKYEGFEPVKTNLMGKVLYEQNGRKAYRITGPDGSVTCIAKSKYDYLESFGGNHGTDAKGNKNVAKIQPAYTDAYAAELKKAGRDDLLQTQLISKKVRKQDSGVVKPVHTKGD